MHRIPVCSTLLRHCRSSATVFQQTTSAHHHLHSKRQLSSRADAEFKSKIALSSRERLKLNLILKCPERLRTLHGLCGERETKYEMSGNGRELHLISQKSDELTAVEEMIRRMLAEIETYQFEISHAARSLLKLDKLIINIRSLLDYGQEWVEVEPRGRSLNDDYIFTATGKPEALASFKRKLNNKLNCIRYFEMPLPEFVPIDQDLLQVFKKINEYPNTVCFTENRTVKCWNLDKDTQSLIRENLQAVVEGWNVDCEESWVGSDVMAKYVQVHLDSKQKSALFDKVDGPYFLHSYDENCVTLQLRGLRYPVKKLATEIARVAREAAYINLPIPVGVLNSLAASQFRSYWNSYVKEMLVILPTESEPSLTLVGPFDCVNHRLLYFYRVLRANFPEKFDLIRPVIVFKYNAESQYKYDESGIISELKHKFPDATFATDKTRHTDSTHSVHLYVSGCLDDLVEINSILKAQVPVVIGPSYPLAGKVFNVFKENNLVSPEVVSHSYGSGYSTLLKGSEPQLARQARDHILNLLDNGHRYRFFRLQTKGIRHIFAPDSLIKEINDFAQSIEMPISISTYKLKHSQKTCISLVEGVGEFTQFLRIRNFFNQKLNFETYREISMTSSDSISSGYKKLWLEQCYEQLLKVLDGSIFLFQRYDTLCVGGCEESLNSASGLIHSALDGLCYDVKDVTRIDNLIEISELEYTWPLVHIWTTKSKHKTYLKMVGDKDSVDKIIQELPPTPMKRSTHNVPLRQKGFPFLNYLGKKIFPGADPSPKSWPSIFPEANCSMLVNRTPGWSITLSGEAGEVEKARRKLMGMMESIHYREVQVVLDDVICEGSGDESLKLKGFPFLNYLGKKIFPGANPFPKSSPSIFPEANSSMLVNHTPGSGDKRVKLKRLSDALMSFNVLKRVIDDTEVTASVGMGKGKLILSVIGDQAEKVELAAKKLQDMCTQLQVEELPLTGKKHLIRHKYIIDLINPKIKQLNESHSFNVEYSIDRKENVITVFGTTDDVKICADKIRDILSDTADVTLDVSEEFQGPFIGDLIRHSYLKYLYPAALLFYNPRDRTLDIYGPRSEVAQVQKFLEDATHETYKIDYHYSNYVTLCRRLKPLATGVLLVEGQDRTVHLVGSKTNVHSIVQMLDFVMGKRKSCHFTLSINNREERVHLGTVTSLVTKSVKMEFPDVRWWLLGNELRFSGPEPEASRALQYVVDKYLKRNEGDNDDIKNVIAES